MSTHVHRQCTVLLEFFGASSESAFVWMLVGVGADMLVECLLSRKAHSANFTLHRFESCMSLQMSGELRPCGKDVAFPLATKPHALVATLGLSVFVNVLWVGRVAALQKLNMVRPAVRIQFIRRVKVLLTAMPGSRVSPEAFVCSGTVKKL